MAVKKTSVNITEENYLKMQQVLADSGMSQTEYINKALAEVPIIMLGNRKNLANSFVELTILLEKNDKNTNEIFKEVTEICRLLNLLVGKIEDLQRLKSV